MIDRPPRTHVVIIDGTLSRLDPGKETNAGLLYKLLRGLGPRMDQSLSYAAGVQGQGLKKWIEVAAGIGLNQTIEDGYAALCSRYQPGDRIMLFGYSRGAYAVRSLAGFIAQVGLLRRRHATQRRVHRAFRYYEAAAPTANSRAFSQKFCRTDVPIAFVGVWDTVGALGLPYPVLSRLAPLATEFHDHRLAHSIQHAAQALALDETRTAFTPIPWEVEPGWTGTLDQCWFPGCHADVGGQVWRYPKARPLSNIPLVWMLDKAEGAGLVLPEGWRNQFPTDPAAPMMGDWRGLGRYFLLRARRAAGTTPGEAEHPSVAARRQALRYRARARWEAEETVDEVTATP